MVLHCCVFVHNVDFLVVAEAHPVKALYYSFIML